MQCPACQKQMVVLEFNQVEVDFCLACRGCWLDRGELGLILTGTVDVPEHWTLKGEKKSKRRCPRCGGKMKAGTLPDTSVEVDLCAGQDGVWLDGGELETIVRERGSDKTAASLAEFVAEVFGRKAAPSTIDHQPSTILSETSRTNTTRR